MRLSNQSVASPIEVIFNQGNCVTPLRQCAASTSTMAGCDLGGPLCGRCFCIGARYTSTRLYCPFTRYHSGHRSRRSVSSWGHTVLYRCSYEYRVGVWSDHLGWRLPFLYAGHVFNLLGCLGLAFAPNAACLVLARGVFGISAATWVGFTVLYASYFPPNETPKAMGVVSAINGISLTIFNGLGGPDCRNPGNEIHVLCRRFFAILGIVFTAPVKERRITSQIP